MDNPSLELRKLANEIEALALEIEENENRPLYSSVDRMSQFAGQCERLKTKWATELTG